MRRDDAPGQGRALVLLAALAAASSSAAARPFALEDLSRLVRLSEPELAPDGGAIALVVARANEDDNRWDAELVLVDATSGHARTLVRGRDDLATPRFSPSGETLAFLARGETSAASAGSAVQVFLLPIDGGEAVQLTRSPRDVETLAWSPDGRHIAFVASAPGDPEPTGPERHNDSFEVGNVSYLTTEPPTATQLWVVAISGGDARMVTREPGSLTAGFGPSPLSWAPDGRSIAYARTPTAASGDADQSWVEIADILSGSTRRLTGRAAFESSPSFSPDGSRVAFAFPRDGDPARVTEIHVAPARGGAATSASAALDRSVLLHRWLGDSRSLWLANDGTQSGLWVTPIEGDAPPHRLELGAIVGVSEVAVARSGAIALVGSEVLRPSELYVLDSSDAPPRRLTDFHSEIARLALARSETLEWSSDDGFRSDGVLTFPPGFDASRRWPLVVYLHGGPTAASSEAFDELAQLMAASGWLVLQPNYRGSDNRGDAHQRGIVAGAGSGPGRDVMAGVEAVKRRGIVDDERIAVSGWSYGGFMTVWMLGHYPDAWRVGVAGAAALDLVDMYSLSDLNVMRRHAITGSPWTEDRAELYRDESPISSVAAIRAPTLILSNTGDARVAVTQSFRLFRALRDLGVETQFVAYPISGHFPSDPVRRRDVYRRWVAWIDDHFARAPERD